MPVEKDQVRSHLPVQVFVDSKKPSNGGPGSALGYWVQFPNLEDRDGLFSRTGWCMLPAPGLLRSGPPNSAPFLDFSHLRS